MSMAPNQTLNPQRMTAVVQALQDTRGIPQSLYFYSRTPDLPTPEDEIIGEWDGRVYIADVIPDDFPATTHNAGRITPVAHAVPNIKHGTYLPQRQLEALRRLAARADIVRDEVGFKQWETATIDRLRVGVLERKEMLCAAMWTNGVSFSYDRRGVKIANISWRTPAHLSVVASPVITDTANAKPVELITTTMLTAQVRNGEMYNRITMSTPLFRAMIATDEFKTKAALYLPQTITYANLIAANLQQQRTLAENVLGLTIDLYDARYTYQNNDGTEGNAPYLPLGLAVLSSSANDNDGNVQRFGSSPTTESLVSSLADVGMQGTLPEDTDGIIAYATGTLNPPSLTYWVAARGFPIKYKRTATAVIDFGSVTDPIPYS